MRQGPAVVGRGSPYFQDPSAKIEPPPLEMRDEILECPVRKLALEGIATPLSNFGGVRVVGDFPTVALYRITLLILFAHRAETKQLRPSRGAHMAPNLSDP